jgi:hypothetical protein
MTPEQKQQDDAEKKAAEKRRYAMLITLGKQGKLWRLEFCYRIDLNSVAQHKMTNLTGQELMSARETMFSHGFLMPIEPGHWRIIQPKDIISVDVWRQANFFDEI